MTDTIHYRVRWEIDVDAANPTSAARKAEAIMRTPVDGTPDQARVFDVRCAKAARFDRIDLAALRPPRQTPAPHQLRCILTVTLEDETGKKPTRAQLAKASDAVQRAITNRLFGEGFLPDDVCVAEWDLTID
ncbi:hypothetical protein [Hyphomicrobium sp. DY-1]|jgi:hypothetical protein|uniref:hypothetical protein n=1 Tax=Hyphomicrobium sp. DY-1 TaxID=3075650 RepID=UPI0039C1A53C